MLIRFRVSNYLSFKNEIELSMVAGKVQKHTEHIMKQNGSKGLNLLRSAIIYGANASGKSNLIKAMNFARHMVVEGVRAKAAIPRKPFRLDPAYMDKPSRFEFELSYGGKIYDYWFSLDGKIIQEECLSEIRSSSEKVLFHRTASSDESNFIEFGIKASKKELALLELVALGTPHNRLFLQESIERNIKHFSDVYEWFENELVIIFPKSVHNLAPIGFGNETKFGETMVEYLKRFGTGVCGYDLQPINDPLVELPKKIIEKLEQSLEDGNGSSVIRPDGQRYFAKKEMEQVKVYKLLLQHRDDTCKFNVFFEMDEESDGTLRLLDLIPMLYSPNDGKNSVVVIDELDRSLHPNLSYEYISSFLQTPNQRQIIVTTHEANLLDLDLLRRDEIWFVEKDNNGASSVYSLEEFLPRYDRDIRKGYIFGRFGAIPMISQFDQTKGG